MRIPKFIRRRELLRKKLSFPAFSAMDNFPSYGQTSSPASLVSGMGGQDPIRWSEQFGKQWSGQLSPVHYERRLLIHSQLGTPTFPVDTGDFIFEL